MEVQFRATESDHLAARIAWSLRHPLKVVKFREGVISLLALALWPVLLVYLAMHPFSRPALRGFIIATLWNTSEVLLIRWQWRKQFAKSNIANADVSAIIDERGMTLSAHGEQKTYWWAGFSQVYESSRVVVFERPYADLLYVPKRAMSTAQLTELVRVASTAQSEFCRVRLASPLA
jgi:hypothetical protein